MGWREYREAAKPYENEFAIALQKKHGGIAVSTCRKSDYQDHIDIWWTTNDGRVFGIDHKTIKHASRHDAVTAPTITWIEIQNVDGDRGWIYGKADFIAFDNIDGSYVVRRTDIIDYINPRILGKSLARTNPDCDFVPYQRDGRKDIVVRVPFADIRQMAKTVVPLTHHQ